MNRNGFRISELAQHVGGRVVGNGDLHIRRVSSLEAADGQSVVYIESLQLLDRASESGAGCCITPPSDQEIPISRIEVPNPKLAFATVAGLLHPPRQRPPGIHPSAVVAPTARVDPSVYVGPHVEVEDGVRIGPGSQILAGVHIGAGVRIGAECVIHPNVVLYDGVVLGDRVVLHAGVVIGAEGFGYVRVPAGYVKFPQLGSVVIEDDVEVGANTCIDRGALGTTRIGRGTKIDDLVMVAHNVQVGERVVMAGQVGISGSTRIGNDVVLAGQVGLADHVHVQDGVQVGAKSAVFPGKIVPAGSVQMGIPARPIAEYKQVTALANRLPQLRAELRELRQEIDRLKAHVDAQARPDDHDPDRMS